MRQIVIVDDEPLILTAYEKLLTKEFNDLHTFDNTYEAFKFINDNQNTIVITDIGMPGVDGEKFTKKLSKDYPSVKVIVTSGQLDDRLRNTLSETGNVLGMLDKPVRFEELIKMIHENIH